MPIIQTKSKDTTNKIQFDARSHTYKINNTYLDSVTAWIGEYFCTPFKEGNKHIFMAHNKAKSNKNKGTGITDADILQRLWTLGGQRAASNGTATHTYIEMLHLYRQYNDDLQWETGYEQAGYVAYNTVVNNWSIIELERTVYSEEYRLAGHIDGVIQHKKSKVFGLLDWKTIGDMHKSYNTMKNELSAYKETPLNKATVQLTTYAILSGLEIDWSNLYIFQLKSDGTVVTFGGKKEPLPNMKKEVLEALDRRKVIVNPESIFKYL